MRLINIKNLTLTFLTLTTLTSTFANELTYDVKKILEQHNSKLVNQEFDLQRRYSVGQQVIVEKMVPSNLVKQAMKLDRSLTENEARKILKDVIFKRNKRYTLERDGLKKISKEVLFNTQTELFERTILAEPKSGITLKLESNDRANFGNQMNVTLEIREPSIPDMEKNEKSRERLIKDVKKMGAQLFMNLEKKSPGTFKFAYKEIVVHGGEVEVYFSERNAGYNNVRVEILVAQNSNNVNKLAQKLDILNQQLKKEARKFNISRKLRKDRKATRSYKSTIHTNSVKEAVKKGAKR